MEDEAPNDKVEVSGRTRRQRGWGERGAVETQMIAVHMTVWVHRVMNTGMIKIYQKNILGPRWRISKKYTRPTLAEPSCALIFFSMQSHVESTHPDSTQEGTTRVLYKCYAAGSF
jgi:hypothetical protein